MSTYVELHLSSAFSFLRGASAPEELARVTADRGMSAAALCDRNGLYGAARFYQAAREHGIRPLVGCELDWVGGGVLPVLVASRRGYRNLCRLLTRVHLRGAKGEFRAGLADMEGRSEGLIALTGGRDGPLREAWERGGRRAVEGTLDWLLRIFPDGNLYVELQRHLLREEMRWEGLLRDLAATRGLSLVATNGVLYAKSEGRMVTDVFTCLRHHTHLDRAGTLLERNAERRIKSPEEMALLFADVPEAIANSVVVAERLEFTLDDIGYRFPTYPAPSGETMDSYLRKLTLAGAGERYGKPGPAVRAQLDRELALIAKLGFSGYFLVVWDLVEFCRRNDIMVQGRGSAANSAVCYCLGITAVDPVGGRLLFERFLSEGRKTWPDIDLDLPSGERREAVIQEVYRRYAPNGAAMTANVITYRGRSAIREIGKVLNFPEETLNRFSSLYAGGDYPHTLDFGKQLSQAGISPRHPRAGILQRLYGMIYGLPRHLGQHPGGMIVCQGELDGVMPLENASMPGRVVAQWDKDDCEDLGIVKVDLLGLGMMSALQDALKTAERRGRPVDLARIPKDDPATYDLMCRADTVGVFQIESRAQMATLPRMQPRTFYDLVIEVAIIRPGPIQGNLVHPYLERRAGRQPVRYFDERLIPVLERTLGVPLFQEQVLKIAMEMADFSGTEAEELRRALNFHRSPERLDKATAKLREAMRRKGVDDRTIEEIAEAVGSFALYGFPESHAISFALLAYASAYLKVHRPAEFYMALLNNQPMGFYSPATLVRDAKARGIRVLPVCVTLSGWDCSVEDDHTIRLGFAVIRDLRRASVEKVCRERARAPFRSIRDLLARTGLNLTERRALALVGALNALAGHRRNALWLVDEAVAGMGLFLAAADETETEESAAGPLAMMSYLERLHADYAGMELSTGAHPMKCLRSGLQGILSAADLKGEKAGRRVTLAGSVICRQRPATARGVVFISLEDETGIGNAVVSSGLFERYRLLISREPFLAVTGVLQSMDGVVCVRAERIRRLDEADALPSEVSHDFF